MTYKYKTIDDLLTKAHDLLAKAEQVGRMEEYQKIKGMQKPVLESVISALETGYYIGDAYQILKQAQQILIKADQIAGQRAYKASLSLDNDIQ